MKYLYISGPITGVKNYRINFKNYELWISDQTLYKPINPAELNPFMLQQQGIKNPDRADYMRVSYHHMTMHPNTDMFFMPGWEKSPGSRDELCLAVDLGYHLIFRIENITEEMFK